MTVPDTGKLLAATEPEPLAAALVVVELFFADDEHAEISRVAARQDAPIINTGLFIGAPKVDLPAEPFGSAVVGYRSRRSASLSERRRATHCPIDPEI